MKIMYMHTIDEKPAFYEMNEQIVFANKNTERGLPRLVESLEQIKREQKLSIAWRKRMGFDIYNDYHYSYIRVIVP